MTIGIQKSALSAEIRITLQGDRQTYSKTEFYFHKVSSM